jgi:hypothetical protein
MNRKDNDRRANAQQALSGVMQVKNKQLMVKKTASCNGLMSDSKL